MFPARDGLFGLSQRELQHCWRAAQFTEKSFRLQYKPNDIARMNVWRDCDIIRVQIEIGKEKGRGTNLNVCSQLLYGATKILRYQADDLLDATTKFLKAGLYQSRKVRRGHDRVIYEAQDAGDIQIDIPQEPRDITNQFDARIDLHLLLDDVPPIPINLETQIDYDARLDFGILTEAEVDIFFSSSNNLEGFEEEVRRDETAAPAQLTDISANVVEHHTIQFEEQTSALEEPLQPPVQPLQTVDPVAEVTESHVDIPIPEITVQELQDPEILPQVPEQPRHVRESVPKNAMQLLRGKSRRIDKTIMLTGGTMRKQIEDYRINTIPLGTPTVHAESVNDLFGRPGSSIPFVAGGTWGKRLTSMFKKMLTLPIMPLPEAPDVTSDMNLDDIEVMRQEPGVVRDEPEERSAENVEKLSTAIPADQQTDLSISNVIQNTTIVLPTKQIPEDSRKDNDDGLNFDIPQLPDITDATTLEMDCVRGEHDKNTLLETIKLYQRKQDPVPFCEMAHQLNYDRNFAIDQFLDLLVLHSTGNITLRQAQPFEEIWILRFSNSGRSSST